jgi:hypothetical protein
MTELEHNRRGWVNIHKGDNLAVIRGEVPPGYVRLCYLDPPFNSQEEYGVVMPGCTAQERAYQDTWALTPASMEEWDREKALFGGRFSPVVSFVESITPDSSKAYLFHMTPRLLCFWECLDDKGVLVIHCDPSMSHYLKVVCDMLFGPNTFLCEVTWKRTKAKSASRKFPCNHDTLLIFTKGKGYTFNPTYRDYTPEQVKQKYHRDDGDGQGPYADICLTGKGFSSTGTASSSQPWREHDPKIVGKGRHWVIPEELRASYLSRTGTPLTGASQECLDQLDAVGLLFFSKPGAFPRYKSYLSDAVGEMIGDYWGDIPSLGSNDAEGVGYPTQKPLALLDRLIRTFTETGDIVMDPYMGSATSIVAAYLAFRRAIGIEVSSKGYTKASTRINEVCGPGAYADYYHMPTTVEAFYELAARDKHLAEKAACFTLGAQHSGKESADGGIDGYVNIGGLPSGRSGRGIVQVKTGEQVTPTKDLSKTDATFRSKPDEYVALVVLLRAQALTAALEKWAGGFGFYQDCYGRRYPKVQFITFEALFEHDYGAIKVPHFNPVTSTLSIRKEHRAQEMAYQNILDLDDGSDLPPI